MLSGELARSESLSSVSLEAEVTFLHLVSVADDFGRFDGRPAILLAALFPTRLEEVTMEALQRWLAELEAEGLIRWYEVEGKRYVEIPSWNKYQRKRAQHSKYPEPKGRCELLSDDRNPLSDDRELRSRVARETRNEKREARGEKLSPDKPAPRCVSEAPKPWASRLSALFYEELASVPGARIPRGAVARGAREIEALAREAPELAKTEDPAPHIEAGIRFALGPENVGREYEVVVRSARALRQKWPQLVASARRWKRERSKSAEGLEGRVLDLARARSSGEGGA